MIIDILKDMRSNASPAFQELLNQYATRNMLFCFIWIFVGISLTFIARWVYKTTNDLVERRPAEDGIQMLTALPVGGAIGSFATAVWYLVTWATPLGGVLNKIL